MTKPNIVVLGAGYGGLMAVTRLQKALGTKDATITLVNKNDYHYESTWLHEGAAGTLHHDRIRYQIKDVISNKVTFIQDSVVKIDRENKKVILENGEVAYDYLVVSLGFEAETFGIKGLKEHAFSISNINAVRKIREHIQYQFATYNMEEEKKDERISFVVGGAGFTGIEFLGELVNAIPELCKEFDVPQEKVRILCVEASPSVLPGFDKELVEYAIGKLQSKGVEFRVGTAIKEATETGVVIAHGEEVEEVKSNNVIWAAGVRGNHIVEESGFETMRGRVKVNEYLMAPGSETEFVIGDCSVVFDPETERPYPPTAQIAMQQGENVAKNIASLVKGKNDKLVNFVYDNKGTVCSLGDDDAVGMVYGKKLTGTSASFMKKVIDDRALLLIGGPGLLAKKGKFKFF